MTFHGRSGKAAFCAGLVLSGAAAFLAGGCGGGGHSSPTPARSQSVVTSIAETPSFRGMGRARLTVSWADASPTPNANSVQFTLTQNGQKIANTDRLLVRPTLSNAAQTESVAVWDDLPTGDVLVSATAYSAPDGTGTPQGEAFLVLVIEDGSIKTATIAPQGTADHLQITMGGLVPATDANPATLFKGDELPLAAVAVDKSNRVLLTSGAAYAWKSDAPSAPVRTASGIANALLAQNPTIARVSVSNADGEKASVSVPVSAFSVAGPIYGEQISDSGWLLQDGHLYLPSYRTRDPELNALLLPDNPLGPRSFVNPNFLNNNNQVAGHIGVLSKSYEDSPLFIWQKSTGVVPITLTGSEKATGILGFSDAGKMLVTYPFKRDTYTYERVGILDPVLGQITPVDLGQQVGSFFRDFSLAKSGQILISPSFYDASSLSTAFAVVVSPDNKAQILPPLPEQAFTRADGANAAGVVVGQSATLQEAQQEKTNNAKQRVGHAIFWTQAGGTVALPPSAFLYSHAFGINEAGLIVGSQSDNGGSFGTLWHNNNRPLLINRMLRDEYLSLRITGAVKINRKNQIVANSSNGTVILTPMTGTSGQ